MQSGDGWLARVKPSAGCVERCSCAVDRRRRAPPRQRSHRPHLARQFADQGTQPSLGGRLRRDHHRRGSCQYQPARWKPSAMSWRARSGPTIPLHPSTLMPLRATSKPCSPASPRFGRCRRNSASSSMAAACCRWQTSAADIMVRPGEGALAVQLDGGTLAALCSPIDGRRNRQGFGARLPSPVRATQRAAAPHARAGDGGRRGGDLRRGRSDCRPTRISRTHARSENRPSD